MSLDYLHLIPGQSPPTVEARPHRAMLVLENKVDPAWHGLISNWLVASGCFYMMAWGEECSLWDDSVDWAALDACDFGDVPDDEFIMTTWHQETLAEAFWFAGHAAHHPTVPLPDLRIIHIAEQPRRDELLAAYAEAQALD
ncbi:MAG: hypothetical protein EON91_08500 [Brevundimonas sp.]|uniref:DUF7684 family protein n=1 Tax=Brevundimonas sp. TaxID=1871086 RepID=UPI0012132247|nr:hypothetical protein [Brevundimonas sp.]RZJ17631.1 MAG: hypothetical protein EON91_08500 [Brevundimonas sp.]